MKNLTWLETTGGPFILISDEQLSKWSGILKKSSYLLNIHEDADDFLDANETDYGKACMTNEYIDFIECDAEKILVLGDEPLPTTCFTSTDNQTVFARFLYGDSIEFINQYLLTFSPNSINNWDDAKEFSVTHDTFYFFDSSLSAHELHTDTNDYLKIAIEKGNYRIWTSIHEPDENTSLILHKFEKYI